MDFPRLEHDLIMRARELSECVYSSTRGLFSFNSHHSRIVFYAKKWVSFLILCLFLFFLSLSLCCTKMQFYCSLRIKRSECSGEYIWWYYYVSTTTTTTTTRKKVTGMKVNLFVTNKTQKAILIETKGSNFWWLNIILKLPDPE